MNKDRAKGALLGMAVGDALGTTYEFKTIQQPDYPTLASAPATDVVGKGPFQLEAGQVTDDTQLAICIARSFVERGGFAPADIAAKYVAWVDDAFDVGRQTLGAIDQLKDGVPYSSAGLDVWRTWERKPAGNGSLMRTTPIAVALAGKPRQELIEAAMVDSMITHADPRCILACAGFDVAIAEAINVPELDGRGMVEAARSGIDVARWTLARVPWEGEDKEHLDRAVVDLTSDLDAALADNPGVYRPGLHVHDTAGFVRVAFRLAFWHAVHTPSWRAAVVDVASRGGDADTNAAIVGALVGARDGIGAIPAAWVERVLAVKQPGPDAWAEAHHPRHLLALLE